MDLATFVGKRIDYLDDVYHQVARIIEDERNAYATNRLLGKSHEAWEIKQSLTRTLRQLKAELSGELEALNRRRSSVIEALKLLSRPISWPLWPKTGPRPHKDVVDDALGFHRENFRNKLERLTNRTPVLSRQ